MNNRTLYIVSSLVIVFCLAFYIGEQSGFTDGYCQASKQTINGTLEQTCADMKGIKWTQ